MKTFKTFLTELMDSPADYDVVNDGPDRFQAKFIINDAPYTVTIHWAFNPNSDNQYNIIFSNSAVPYNDSMEILGTGNAATVFSTVAAIVKDHFQKYKNNIKAYQFTAKEPSRRKLYKRFATMMKSKLRFSEVETEMVDGELVFIIKR